MKHDKGFLQRILKSIEKGPLRMTRKRERLLGALVAIDRPVSAAELRDKADLPESDLVTVYRTLEAFEGIGIIQRIPLEDSGYLFELTEPDDHHHHFMCRECHRTERLDFCLAQELEAQAQKLGFTEVTHMMEVYGICEDCQPGSASDN
ncbi:Fur family transcriptional regulator [Rubellicoccus peritrichatus]|uniref:Fur family transcriptional regulator n=1 Tax=Rubellicoccus peritrichatus TaxID=3080537 RepID=A0AAQ3L6I8_9BACT|nr:Fur family transcriptional regulator [Puniceicoccus sp. CR14]WOO39906.1 Fur family transcriptional regulator [Puniceicoccus sp. CR14]